MNHPAKFLSVLLLTLSPLIARPQIDIITMKNGDKITGEIKSLRGGVLLVSLDYVDGNISIDWLKVARVESKQLFIVQAQDGALYTGTLFTSPEQTDHIEVADPELDEKATLEKGHVVSLEETGSAFLKRLSGDVELGLLYSKGNNNLQNNFGTSVEYQRDRFGVEATYASSLSSTSGAETSTRNQFDLEGYHALRKGNNYIGAYGTLLQSSVQGISRQGTLGGGIGRFFKNTNRVRVSVLGGFAWQTTDYNDAAQQTPKQQVATALFLADVRFFFFKKTNLAAKAFLLPALSDAGRVRFNTNISYYLKLFKNLSWNYSFYGNWDTRPPSNFEGSDYGYSSGLRWTFGYR
jgi:hypothetical protein